MVEGFLYNLGRKLLETFTEIFKNSNANVRGINLTTRKAVYVRRHGARNRRCYVTMIMRVTKEVTYDYNLNTDSLQEVITYDTIE